MNLKIEEKLDVHDAIAKGVVVLRDSEGNIIFRKNNMILLEGRKHLLSKLLNPKSALEFSGLALGDGTENNVPEFTLANMGNSNIVAIDSVGTSNNTSTSYINDIYYTNSGSSKVFTSDGVVMLSGNSEITYNPNSTIAVSGGFITITDETTTITTTTPAVAPSAPFMRIEKVISGGDIGGKSHISELGLVVGTGDDAILFSRLFFQPVYFGDGDTYKITYYIYL